MHTEYCIIDTSRYELLERLPVLGDDEWLEVSATSVSLTSRTQAVTILFEKESASAAVHCRGNTIEVWITFDCFTVDERDHFLDELSVRRVDCCVPWHH